MMMIITIWPHVRLTITAISPIVVCENRRVHNTVRQQVMEKSRLSFQLTNCKLTRAGKDMKRRQKIWRNVSARKITLHLTTPAHIDRKKDYLTCMR